MRVGVRGRRKDLSNLFLIERRSAVRAFPCVGHVQSEKRATFSAIPIQGSIWSIIVRHQISATDRTFERTHIHLNFIVALWTFIADANFQLVLYPRDVLSFLAQYIDGGSWFQDGWFSSSIDASDILRIFTIDINLTIDH